MLPGAADNELDSFEEFIRQIGITGNSERRQARVIWDLGMALPEAELQDHLEKLTTVNINTAIERKTDIGSITPTSADLTDDNSLSIQLHVSKQRLKARDEYLQQTINQTAKKMRTITETLANMEEQYHQLEAENEELRAQQIDMEMLILSKGLSAEMADISSNFEMARTVCNSQCNTREPIAISTAKLDEAIETNDQLQFQTELLELRIDHLEARVGEQEINMNNVKDMLLGGKFNNPSDIATMIALLSVNTK